jgi:acetyl/propionyl-CoA carboxylase alpha subunit/acetyl-CoA carboxylase carboxyltransferase component
MNHDFQRVAIVNRSEAAMRFIHAVREFNQEYGTSMRTIALFSEVDRHALFVREADEAMLLGAARSTEPGTNQSKNPYLDYGRIERALTAARAEAVWAGWGFLSEHAEFADLCREIGVVFMGPDGDVMRRLGDKIAAKRLAVEAHIPVAPWSEGSVDTLEDAWQQAERLGYPLLVKATSGYGGRGIRVVQSAKQLPKAFESARAEAFESFGNPTVFLEQLVRGARQVEAQIIADLYGTTWAAGVRDCTIQRHHRKILEEAPCPALSPRQDQALRAMAVRLSQAASYTSVGTVKFLYQPESERFFFIEMNTGLQVDHPVTECTTGLDLVKTQIHIARGGHLEGEPPRTRGHAIAARLTAEDTASDFAPAPGTVERLKIPTGAGLRVDTGVVEGDTVPAEFDSTIVKLTAHGATRVEAFSRLERALRDSVVVIKDGACNKELLLQVLNRVEVQTGEVDTGWLDRMTASGELRSERHADVALMAAAIEAYEAELAVEQTQFYASAARLRPSVRSEVGRTLQLRYRGHRYSTKVYRLGLQRYRVEMDGARLDADIDRVGPFEYWLTGSGWRLPVVSVADGRSFRIEVDGVSHRLDRDDGGVVRAPAPAVVVSLAVKPGDTVSLGDPLAVLEAMKMEMPVLAPFSGKVRQVMTIPNVQVDSGAPLVQIEPTGEENIEAAGERVVLGASLASDANLRPVHSRCRQNLEELRQLMLGFDVDPASSARLFAEWSRNCPAESSEITRAENEILNIFVDISALFDRQPAIDGVSGGEAPSAEAYLFSYLRMLGSQGAGLPTSFVERLRRALAHYGVLTLDHTAELEQSLLWICKSHQRGEQQIAPIQGVLERRLQRVEARGPDSDGSFRTLLDRMIPITRGLSPALSDLAQEVRYRTFDQPLFEHARKQDYAQAEANLAALAGAPDAADRREIVRALVECPQPLAALFSGRFATADAALRQVMLEVLTLRHYRIRTFLDFGSHAVDGHRCVTAEYDYEDKRIHVLATHADFAGLREALQTLFPLIAEFPAEQAVVIDCYVWQPTRLDDPEAVQQEVCSVLNQTGFQRPMRRITVAVAAPSHNQDVSGVQFFTYRLCGNGYQEERFFRGIHPMMAKRLHLWRLNNFRVERFPSVEDVYLLHGVAHDNPKDERLFACAEVRDLTPVRDAAGHIVQLPHLERMLMEALAAIRRFQFHRRPQERLYWNRVLLYVWPPFHLTPEELHTIVHRLAPATEGLGLEQLVVRARIPNAETGVLSDMIVRISSPGGAGLLITFRPANKLQPIKPLTEYDQKVVRMRQRGLIYPYEIVKMLTPTPEDTRAEFPIGDFVEHDLDADQRLIPVERLYGKNKANIIVGLIRNFTARYPEGMTRVLLMGDPGKDLGALAEPECRRIIAAIDLAEQKGIPVEWFPISAGAKISMESGVENMDWIARVLRRLIEFTQAGGEVNLVVNGINVGAQPYWNAEATMLMHTKGILVMTPKAAMVLTGKRALDFSGSISAEDNLGIGGYDRIMGFNGQAQYWARDIEEACHILLQHYEHTYIAPGERFPRRAVTKDPVDRDVQLYLHSNGNGNGFAQVGEIFSDQTNPGRKKPFEIRKVMMATVDQDHPPLERWAGMRGAETAVVWDAHLGGYPVCLIGIESQPVPRLGFTPADGPEQWTSGTLFPLSSKKVARAINAASNNRPVVLLANLSGFDGSPESMRKLQLEYGAEIGRAVVNFKGPMIFCVISRYHGGAYVVFSQALNEHLEVAALEGTYASVIGGAPAAAVVFAGEVDARARKDPRLLALNEAIARAEGAEQGRLRSHWQELFKIVHSEKLGEMAEEFDRVHDVHRALRVGALRHIIPPANLRPHLIHAIERALGGESDSQNERPEAKVVDEVSNAA